LNVLVDNERCDAISDLIRREDPDIVAFQEFEPTMDASLQSVLGDLYPYREYCRDARPAGGLGVYSRIPFRFTGLYASDGHRPYAMRVTLEPPKGAVDVYNVHLLPTYGETFLRMGATPNVRLRAEQARALTREIETRGVPALALGDFNFTEASEGYELMRRQLVDAWHKSGRGLGWTWPRLHVPFHNVVSWPLLRIDYCFCTAQVWPARMRVIRDRLGTDHCPILVDTAIGVTPRPRTSTGQ
jgi:endonuclease/exonuclease/phosphatase family metal-dependent hydrolase